MARDAYEKVHDAAVEYTDAYTEQKDYAGEAVRKGHRVNVALDALNLAIAEAVVERSTAEGEEPAPDEEPTV